MTSSRYLPQVVLITGATAGFGEASARRFAAEGCRLILLGRREERLRLLSASLSTPTYLLALDVRDRAAVTEAFAALPPEFSDVDLLVNNAGLALGMEAAQNAVMDDWDRMIDTNLKGLILCARLLLPGMIARGRGHVINLGSVAGEYPYPGGNVYGATKAFVKQFSLNLRSDLLGTPVRVTCIEPGMAETEFTQVRLKGDEQAARNIYQGLQPLTADDVAEAIFYCATAPLHVNVNRLELMPVAQAFSPFAVHRRENKK